MKRFENVRRIVPAAMLLAVGASACNSNKESSAKKPSPMVCSTVKPAYERPVSANTIIIGPEPGLNSQFYMLIEQGNQAQVLQKELKADTTESAKTLNLSNLVPGDVDMVSFKDASPGVTMEFKAEYMNSQIAGQIATLVMPMVCTHSGSSQTL